MSIQKHSCAITGASGYLGSRLVRALSSEGWAVYQLTRQVPNGSGNDQLVVPFSLSKGAPENFFKNKKIETLIHCAHDFRPTRWSEIFELNVKGSIRLMEAARAEGVQTIIFISTMSAFEGCRSLYGKAKLAVEKRAFQLGATVVRPGLIYADEPGGMVGSLNKALKFLPVIPLLGNGKQILHLVHEEDLTLLVKRLCLEKRTDLHGPITAAAENGKTFAEILRVLAAAQGRRPRFIPVPWQLCWGLLKTIEMCGVKLRFRSDSVVSLINQDPNPKFEATCQTGVHFRDFTLAALGP